MIMTISEKVNYYVGLLILQYIDKPNARATIAALASALAANDIAYQVLNAFNVTQLTGSAMALMDQISVLDSLAVSGTQHMRTYVTEKYSMTPAAGKQLDILGTYTGISRFYVSENKQLALTDSEYRILLQLKAINNTGNHSWQEINNACSGAFGGDLIPINAGIMTLVYLADKDKLSSAVIAAALYHNALPRPMCVLLLGIIVKPKTPWFSFTNYREGGNIPPAALKLRTGFQTYQKPKDGQWLIYDNLITNA